MSRPSTILLASLAIVSAGAVTTAVLNYRQPAVSVAVSTPAPSAQALPEITPESSKVDAAMAASTTITSTQVDTLADSLVDFDTITEDAITTESALTKDPALDAQLTSSFAKDAF